MNGRAALGVGLVLLAACAGGRGAQVGERPTIEVCFFDPHCLADYLEIFLRDQKAAPVIDLPKKIADHKSGGDWKS
ncbi:MAG TPA: hypothetical protein VFB81_18340, partial [Myxococcales bacterium]|nr:hypothetical protein [Myxococcales bacterium]